MGMAITSWTSIMATSAATVRAAGPTYPASQILKAERLEFNVLIFNFSF
ncbi:hypothetical protein VCRA2113O324_350002 [Vibrio crassostreae]|nr:hypothetical protein VCRA2113O324_350002 [Vibrio crassostreae]CAK2171612.1 hypothetical protein VCRA2111O320_550003 [Vibrio crassostreae]CAK2913745.1 hypothetical protein VCRA2121O336_340023 [Vibrio crassostreae]CAK3427947.1 hypothetical protein VCRA2120O329_340002 [Vibrio crassostreae]